MFIDTHAHLDLEQFPDVASVIDSAIEVGVRGVINIGFGPERWQTTLALAEKFPQIAYTLGFHPGDAERFTAEAAAQLAELVSTTSPVGIGEAGIDLFRDANPPLPLQRKAFAFQIELALQHDLPLVVHQRAAEAEVYQQLAGAPPDLRVILHSFDGTKKTLDLALERGWHIGVGGLMTRRSAPVPDLLKSLPLDRFVLETDSPYLIPAGVKERRNTPASIPLIAERFAGVRGVPVETIQEAAWTNAFVAFPQLAGALALEAMTR